MFNLNEYNRIVMAQHPTDMRKGVNTLCGEVRRVGLDLTNGDGTSTTTRAAAAEQSPGHRVYQPLPTDFTLYISSGKFQQVVGYL